MEHSTAKDRIALAKRASLLHLNAITLADGMRNGSFKSLYRGHGIEFSGVRDYIRGDDVRAIDWNVTARMGKPYIKMFEEERELNVFIIIDTSLTMNTGSDKKTRLEVAIETAELLTLASEQNDSPVGAVLFDNEITFSCPLKTGRSHIMMLLTHFEEIDGGVIKGSALDKALQGADKLLRKRTLVFVISDFRTSQWEDNFGKLCAYHDVVAIRIADPVDEEIPEIGSIPFIDPETEYKTVLPTSSKAFIRAWHNENNIRVDEWKRTCLKNGGIPLILHTNKDPMKDLTRFFSERIR